MVIMYTTYLSDSSKQYIYEFHQQVLFSKKLLANWQLSDLSRLSRTVIFNLGYSTLEVLGGILDGTQNVLRDI
jgi:hypothetical protein